MAMLLLFFLEHVGMNVVVSQEGQLCHTLEFINKTYRHETLFTKTENRVTFLKDGDFNIQIITNYDCNYVLTRYAMSILYTSRYALQMIENKFNRSFGLQVDTNCDHVNRTMSFAFETISEYHENSFCYKNRVHCLERMVNENNSLSNKRILGVIGTESSFTTYSLANLLAVDSIPIVSWLATSDILDQTKSELRSFFRTAPSDQKRVKAIFDLLLRFNWTYVAFIGSNNLYGRTAFKDFNKLMNSNSRICVGYHGFIDDIVNTKESEVVTYLQTLKQKPKVKIVVAFVRFATQKLLIKNSDSSLIWVNFWGSFAHRLNEGGSPELLKMKSSGRVIVLSYDTGLMTHKRNEFVQKKIQEEFKCDEWLRTFVYQNYGCNITGIVDQSFTCQENVTVSTSNIAGMFDSEGGYRNLVIDSIHAMGLAIHQACDKTPGDCKPIDIVDRLKTVNFTNANGEPFTFDRSGNPESIFYRFNLLQYNEVTKLLENNRMGSWSNSKNISIDNRYILWDATTNSTVKSQCSTDCQKGFIKRYKNATESTCCWECEKCLGVRNYSNSLNQKTCLQCGNGNHTDDNINCKETPIRWVSLKELRGILVFAISTIGFVFGLVVAAFFFKYRRLATLDDQSPLIYDLICLVIIFNYLFAITQIVEPTEGACVSRTCLFFILLMAFSWFLLLLTQQAQTTITEYANLLVNGNYTLTQMMLLIIGMILHIGFLVLLFEKEGSQVSQENASRINEYTIKRWCQVDLTSIRLVLLCVPILKVIIASFFAFRERNQPQSFYERQFLTLGCLCVILLLISVGIGNVFISSYHDYIMLCCGTQFTGFVFMICFIMPRIYVGLMRSRYGEHLFRLNVKDKPRNEGKPMFEGIKKDRDGSSNDLRKKQQDESKEASRNLGALDKNDGLLKESKRKEITEHSLVEEESKKDLAGPAKPVSDSKDIERHKTNMSEIELPRIENPGFDLQSRKDSAVSTTDLEMEQKSKSEKGPHENGISNNCENDTSLNEDILLNQSVCGEIVGEPENIDNDDNKEDIEKQTIYDGVRTIYD
ncbi:metabotropic glutamate receptor 5-like [Clytia hemisphaerica]|uniref:metabotropic glutamate receptor 5-like n=1 Tax=Clytia hemisphaerica TaxID=252671 RepID=UPI0034D40C64